MVEKRGTCRHFSHWKSGPAPAFLWMCVFELIYIQRSSPHMNLAPAFRVLTTIFKPNAWSKTMIFFSSSQVFQHFVNILDVSHCCPFVSTLSSDTHKQAMRSLLLSGWADTKVSLFLWEWLVFPLKTMYSESQRISSSLCFASLVFLPLTQWVIRSTGSLPRRFMFPHAEQ